MLRGDLVVPGEQRLDNLPAGPALGDALQHRKIIKQALRAHLGIQAELLRQITERPAQRGELSAADKEADELALAARVFLVDDRGGFDSRDREQVAAHDAQLQQRCEQLAARSALTDLGADYYDWARNEGLAEEPWLASSCLTPVSADSGQTRLLHPQSGDEFMLLNDLPLADQAIPVRVRNRTTEARLGLWVDGELALTLSAPFTGRIPARGGRHVVSLRDASGRELDRAEFTVRHERRL